MINRLATPRGAGFSSRLRSNSVFARSLTTVVALAARPSPKSPTPSPTTRRTRSRCRTRSRQTAPTCSDYRAAAALPRSLRLNIPSGLVLRDGKILGGLNGPSVVHAEV